ncbi:hypothetical protein [Streptomyces spongiae]|uniref:Uncharacterized protein n=1 Tax=Streptomyces spongiae TaxID=565072 RepID=A0A5N8XTA5_9ACTN|nr:hypothetical protein [Streptomyces spongiae]MPY62446.1 hypothetical protein [Streptomyces spongiae]
MAPEVEEPPRSPLERLRDRLERLHRQSGRPSARVIASRTDGLISHETATGVLRCSRPPTWSELELVVEALGGDPEAFRVLWRPVSAGAMPLAAPVRTDWPEEEAVPKAAAVLTISDLDAAEEDLHEQVAERRQRESETRRELFAVLEARADLSDRIGALREQLGRERGRNEELRRRVAALEAECQEHTRGIERLQDELRALREERVVLLEKLNGLNLRRCELYFSWARDEEARRRRVEEEHRAKDSELRVLQDRLAAAEALLMSMYAQAGQHGEPGHQST